MERWMLISAVMLTVIKSGVYITDGASMTGPDYGSGDVSSLDERHVKSDYSKDDYNVELGSGSLDQALKLEQLNRQEQITIGYDSRTVSESEPERGNEIKSKNDNQTLLYPPHKNQNTVSVPKNIRDPLASLDKGVGSNHSSANSSHSHNILGNMSRSNGTSGDATEGSSGDGEVTSASGDELLSSIQKETQDLLTEFRENVYSRSENKSVNETASTSLSPEDEGQKRDGGIKIEESMLNDQEAVSQKQSVSLTETENKGFPSDFNDTFGIMNVEEDVNPSNTSSSRNECTHCRGETKIGAVSDHDEDKENAATSFWRGPIRLVMSACAILSLANLQGRSL